MKKLLFIPLLLMVNFTRGQFVSGHEVPSHYKPGDSLLVFSVKGSVTDKYRQSPIKGIMVDLVSSEGEVHVAKTDSIGQYTFGSDYIKPETSYILSAEDENYMAGTHTDKINITTVGLTASKVFIVNFTLEKCKGCTLGRDFVAVFDSGKTKITQGMADTVLSSVLKFLKSNPAIVIQVDGHSSSNEGSEQTKMALSKARAEAYRNYLVAFGIDGRRIKTKGWSDSIKITIPEDDAEDLTQQQQLEYINRRSRYASLRIIDYRYKPRNSVVR